ncbi:MAG TPA: 1-deoxy-D-xylulose-5-phosphate reductoisomerase, partial [Candidatus Cloacimonadota bacterium]|nr:1-deoxy-D-xylulose-5-phosphate reductoisomerase [Candidatus Cloacimonadota bacterium]
HHKLCSIAREFQLQRVLFTGINDPDEQRMLRHKYSDLTLHFGEQELLTLLANEDYDIALNAISGSAGIRASFAILNRAKPLALANKESLVMGGHLVAEMRQQTELSIIPVDSEHSAIFQAIGKHPARELDRLIITASGGAFRSYPLEQFDAITPAMALKHPNWDMGAKVTLDSATMFNKALEVMEAHWLFELPYESIEAVIHPQSVVHSLVRFVDGSYLAQLSAPDMKLPILYALSYPQRWQSQLVQTDLLKLGELSFSPIEEKRYPLYYLGLEVASAGGLLPTVMNAAVEAAMQLFMRGELSFTGIPKLVRDAVEHHPNQAHPDLETIIQTNQEVYSGICRS